MSNEEDTNPTNVLELVLEELRGIREELRELKFRIHKLEQNQAIVNDRMNQMIIDLNTIHVLQKTFTQRLSSVEEFCTNFPLQSKIKLVGD